MISTKIFSAVALFGAIFLSSTAATSLPSRSIQCYKCPQEVTVLLDDKKVPFDLASHDEDLPHKVLECL
jgi:hypothetical protein